MLLISDFRSQSQCSLIQFVEFFRQAYLHTTSQKTRAVALSCLFRYSQEGRKVFYELANAGRDDNQFFKQIEIIEQHEERRDE